MTTGARLLGLLTDFGMSDGYVGVMKAVILGIAPEARLVDLSHDVAPQDIEGGAWILGTAWRSFPERSVLLCVIDPGVGSARRAIALEAHGRIFVGPDNGLFTYPLAKVDDKAPPRCVLLDDPTYHLPAPSATFHGRDIFAPCAAHLAAGAPLTALGSPVDSATLTRLPIELRARRHGDVVTGRVAHIDHYGNLITSIGPALARVALREPLAYVSLARHVVTARASHFSGGPQAEPFFLQDSSGALAIVLRDGSAAVALGARRGDEVTLRGLSAASLEQAGDEEEQG
ncbi:MAG TPA: SAM-dependent chlorinase/fluorinase [Ktedonobacterales bacterium]|jgi:S-adenosylmethionine hydrolase|nr:SAM-dependent chlorinase/fluorinase [Ktedonobacterales bacterium]